MVADVPENAPQYSNATVWLDASNIDGNNNQTLNTEIGTPGTEDFIPASRITQWIDVSKNGHHATAAGVAAPTYVKRSTYDAVSFDGVYDFINFNEHDLIQDETFRFFMVIDLDPSDSDEDMLFSKHSSDNINWYLNYIKHDGTFIAYSYPAYQAGGYFSNQLGDGMGSTDHFNKMIVEFVYEYNSPTMTTRVLVNGKTVVQNTIQKQAGRQVMIISLINMKSMVVKQKILMQMNFRVNITCNDYIKNDMISRGPLGKSGIVVVCQ